MGLSPSDLFSDKSSTPSPNEAFAAPKCAQGELERVKRHAAYAAACDRVLRWESIVDELFALLARQPDDAGVSEIERLIDHALEKLHQAEEEERSLRP